MLFQIQWLCLMCFVKCFTHFPWTINNENEKWLFQVRKSVYKGRKIQCSFIFSAEYKAEPWCLLTFQNNMNKKVTERKGEQCTGESPAKQKKSKTTQISVLPSERIIYKTSKGTMLSALNIYYSAWKTCLFLPPPPALVNMAWLTYINHNEA